MMIAARPPVTVYLTLEQLQERILSGSVYHDADRYYLRHVGAVEVVIMPPVTDKSMTVAEFVSRMPGFIFNSTAEAGRRGKAGEDG